MEFTVSVRLMTFNHSKFIKEAMDGIMMQKTNFKMEVVVGDDFSSDNTLGIIRSYKETENIKIKILEREKGDVYWVKRNELGRLYNFTNILENCNGKYIALLDGDDYWVDPLKLQKQVDFLEQNTIYIGCAGNARSINDTLETSVFKMCKFSNKAITQNEIVKENPLLTLTVMFRNVKLEFDKEFYQQKIGDWLLFTKLSNLGDFFFIDEVWATYRLHEGGIFSKADELWKSKMLIQTYCFINKITQKRYQTEIDKCIYCLITKIFINSKLSLSKRISFLINNVNFLSFSKVYKLTIILIKKKVFRIIQKINY